MRHTSRHHRFVALALTVLASSPCWSQSAATPASAAAAKTAAAVEPRIETIHVEDKANAIDEVRVGGQTRSIDVKPKNGMPAYQVSPSDGQRSWKVLGF